MNGTVFATIYRLKVLLLAVALMLLGLLLSLGSDWLSSHGTAHVVVALTQSLSDILVVTGGIGLAVDYFTGRDKDAADIARTRAVLEQLTPEFTDAVVRGFAVRPEDLKRVATPELLDSLAANAMALRLGDSCFAAEIYADVRDQAIRAPERWYDVQVNIRLASTAVERSTVGAPLFDVLVEWEYTTTPAHAVRRFACVSDRDEFNELATEVPATSTWLMTPQRGVDASDRRYYELLTFSVDGVEQRIRRQERRGGQTYSVHLPAAAQDGRPVRIKHLYRTTVTRSGHYLFIELPQPTFNLSLKLDYTNAPVSRMSIMDLVSSSQRTRVAQLPKQAGAREISVDLPGWLLPRAGFSFVWTLASEAGPPPAEATHAT